jgi:hypothetical protein
MRKVKRDMKRAFISMMFLLVGVLVCQADEPQKFSPEKFQAEMEQFIAKEAGLTTDESEKFFPLYREMQQKQRAVFGKMRQEGRVKPTDDASCKRLVQKRDEVELELKKIQQTYHNKFFTVLSPSKVFDVLRAEEKFHRQAFRNMSKGFRQNHSHRK